ncbi:MAG TPA: hypothetical protein VMA13_00515 [Candidatus Saccharimonadales bacterium]|nr:hypothetical protein [Candidatus Saccharimonadales bacterium]
MPLLFWVVPYIVAGGILWLIACQAAPLGREVKLSQGIIAVILIGLCSEASTLWLMPLIGYWHLIPMLAASVLVAMATLELSFRRSLVAVLLYFAFWAGVGIAIELLAHMKPSP